MFALQIKKSLISAAAAVFVASVGFGTSAAHALTVGFTQITTNGATGGADQLSVDITDNGSGGALFDFNVITGVNTGINVAEIYFDDRTPLFVAPLTQPQIIVQVGTDFTAGSANPGDLPGGGSVGFNVTAGLLADAEGRSSNGLTIGDDLQMFLNFAGNYDFSNLLASLNDGTFRIGMHVRSHEGGFSEGYVNTSPNPVPLPAAGILLITALGGLGVAARRRRKSS